MNLVRFSNLLGKSVSQIINNDINAGLAQKLITRAQAAELMAELKKADSLWRTSDPDVPCASSLW